MVGKKKAIEICKNLLRTIRKIEAKPLTTITYIRDDMFSVPTASKSDLKKKLKSLINKFDIKEREILL